jgi:hypothetical protein
MACLPVILFPSINWFAQAIETAGVKICKEEIYDKRKHTNRFSIASANGEIELSVPLLGGRNQKAKLNELFFSGKEWKRKHLHALQSAYGKSPYFEFYSDEVEKIISSDEGNFFSLAENSIKFLSRNFIPEIKIEILESESEIISLKKFLPIKYHQVFEQRFGFMSNLSALDLLFNSGPDSRGVLNIMLASPQ